MRLEMGHIYIKDIQFASESKIEDGILYVSEEAVKAVALEDEKIKSVSFDIAKPGESVRITPVKDVIEPRVKVEGRGGVFPGVIAKVDTVGEGKTYALKGMAVVTAGKIVGFQEGIIDMTGPGADYTPFSKTLNLVMVCEPVDDIKQHDYEKAVRFAGFRVATYIAELARDLTPDETKVYETCTIKEGFEKYPDLPIEGEMQFDAAVSPRVARTKCPDSKVAGHANTFIFPDINAGNIGYKIAQRMGNFDAYGPILLGLNAPVNDLSRGCNAAEVYSMAIITAALA